LQRWDVHDVATALTFGQFVRGAADAFGDAAAVVLGEEVLTYRQLDERSARLARGLLDHGVGKGTRVGILFPNSPHWAVAWAAVVRMGAVAVPLSTFLKPPELARVVRHADLHGIISQSDYRAQDFVAAFEGALPELASSEPDLRLEAAPFLRWIAFTSEDPPAWSRRLEWLEADVGRDDQLLLAAEGAVHPDDPGLVIYTSGQSADPKGVIHSHRSALSKVHYVQQSVFHYQPGSALTANLPFFWVGGMIMTLFPSMEGGGTVHCPERSTFTATIAGSVAKEPAAAGLIDPSKPRVGLGMTETFGIYSWGTERPHPDRPLCTPLTIFDPEVETKVVSDSGETVVGAGRGEMRVRGRGVTLGLHKVPRSQVFDADGYYMTGDQCEVDGDVTYFLGRLGDMIKTSGANVAPPEVERELVALDGVASAYVVAVPDPTRGELVGAAIVPMADAQLDVDDIAAQLRASLSTYKIPRLIVVCAADEIPITPSMKLKKRELAQLIRDRGQEITK
jgi:acyl-CoA synthetase (AMP-forming)/AMP-acid ligase II